MVSKQRKHQVKRRAENILFNLRNISKMGLSVKDNDLRPGVKGVYLLYKDDDILYVGRTYNLLARVGEHARDVEFDKFRYIPVEDNNLLGILELMYICLLKPKMNMETITTSIDKIMVYEAFCDEFRDFLLKVLD